MITPQQALANLYQGTRQAPLTADQHQILAESAKVLDQFINPPTEVKEVKK